jgi:hypothetical protein
MKRIYLLTLFAVRVEHRDVAVQARRESARLVSSALVVEKVQPAAFERDDRVLRVSDAFVSFVSFVSTAVQTSRLHVSPYVKVINNMLTYHPEAAEYLVEGQHIDTPGDHGRAVRFRGRLKVTAVSATPAACVFFILVSQILQAFALRKPRVESS